MKRRFRRTTIISVGLFAFLIGLSLVRVTGIQVGLVAVIGLVPLMLVFKKRTLMTILVAILFGLFLGVWRGGIVQKDVARYEEYIGQDVILQGRVVDDPVYDDKGRLDFRVGNVAAKDESLPGQVRVRTFTGGVRRGDSVLINGKLSDGFGSYQAAVNFGTTRVLDNSSSPLEAVRREFFASVYSVLPEPQASLGLGFLVGLRSALPEDLDDQLRIAGLTHIVVASGYNLTILVRLSRRILSKYSKYQALVGSIALILAFLAITGANPSMVRASVVTILSLVAWYYGRKFQPILIILLGAALTAGYNPLYIWYDLGWWLSFLAFAGVLIIAPLVQARFYGEKSPPLLIQVGIETVAAQIMATPLILFVFGDLSVVAIAANLAVVPFIPFAMITTFIAGVAQVVIGSALASWLAVPANIILSYIVEVTQFFASFAWAQQSFKIQAIGMTALYSAVFAVVLILARRSKNKLDELPSIVE